MIHIGHSNTMSSARHVSLVIAVIVSFLPTVTCVIRLASWNLLAPVYSVPCKYPWCAPEFLEWDYRKSLIVPQLLQFDADILCLQEVQVDTWPDLLDSLPGYTGILQDVKGGHPVASAVLVRPKFQVRRVESRSRVLIVVLEDCEQDEPSSSPLLYLCNVHLEAGMSHDDNLIRYHQLKSLFKRLTNQCRLDQQALQEASIIMAGDFNMLNTNPLHTCLTQGLLQDPQNIEYTFPCTTTKLQDAYMWSKHRLGKTYSKGGVLDYIWTSDHVNIQDTLILHPSAKTTDSQQLPSKEHPSDHLPIGVDLVCR
jgi:mRNA deadenylase 3'-5' endonuclease subunit Ccr4